MQGDVIEELARRYEKLTKSEKKVADYVFAHHRNPQFMSITSLAEECRVAEATIFRFCKTLGFKGYNEFKLALAKAQGQAGGSQPGGAYGAVGPGDALEEVYQKVYSSHMEVLEQTLATLHPGEVEKASALLLAADRVFCFGQGGSLILAMEAWARFSTIAPNFYCIEDAHMQAIAAALLTGRDVVLFCSYSGATKDMEAVLGAAKERGAKVILLTRFAKSPAAAYASAVLQCCAREGPLQMGSVAAKVALLFVVDVLFNDYCRRIPEQAMANQEATAAVLAGKML